MTDEPKPGERWKWMWSWVTIQKVGPARIYWYADDGEVHWSPRDRFLSRYHRTGIVEERGNRQEES